MIRRFLRYIATCILHREMATLERYRDCLQDYDRWFAKYGDISTVLRHLSDEAEQRNFIGLVALRKKVENQRKVEAAIDSFLKE